jgi:hypothetical protein
MAVKPALLRRFRVTRRLAAIIGLLAGFAPATAHAQTNLDQGKSPGQIFASDCAECHKSVHGLAKGKNSAALTEFLREHYTTSRQQAAGLAAYVLHGGGEGGGTQKPAAEHPKASAEEPKAPKQQGRQSAKPEGTPPAAAKLQPPPAEEANPADESIVTEEPGVAAPRSAAGRHEKNEKRSATATRGPHKDGATAAPAAAPEPAAVVAEPNPSVTANPEPSPAPTAAAPTEASPDEGAPVPRDNIPD